MIVKLSSAEKKTLQSLDPKGSGPKPWQTAREVGGGVFRKKPENLTQEEIRVVRNSFRKLVREALVEMNSGDRGQYRISDRGRKLAGAGMPEFESRFQRGEATQAAKAAGEARLKERPRKAPAKKASTKKAPKKAAAKKAAKPKAAAKAPKKAPKKTAKKSPTKKAAAKTKAPKIEVEDKTQAAASTKSEGGNGEHKKPKFKRRQALKVKNSQTSAEG